MGGPRPKPNLWWVRETIDSRNVNQRDSFGHTIFSFVYWEGSDADIAYLLDLGIELSNEDYRGLGPKYKKMANKRVARALLQLRRRKAIAIGDNNRDVLRLIAKCVMAH